MTDNQTESGTQAGTTSYSATIQEIYRRAQEIGRLSSELIALELDLGDYDTPCISTHVDAIRDHSSDLRRDMRDAAQSLGLGELS